MKSNEEMPQGLGWFAVFELLPATTYSQAAA
jgi:hypothetical protein